MAKVPQHTRRRVLQIVGQAGRAGQPPQSRLMPRHALVEQI